MAAGTVLTTAIRPRLARHLLTETAARDIEITSQNLESVFLALTSEGAPA